MFNNDWNQILDKEFNKEYYKNLIKFIAKERETKQIFPTENNVFKALELTPYSKIKVVIIGQDPYHGLGQANGLAFSVNSGVKLPKSLKNIYQELKNDLGIVREDGDLSDWARQGVLLLNTTLTVQSGIPLSHSNIGWDLFTDAIIKKINQKLEPIVFILWGRVAIKKETIINKRHHIIKSSHPSPLSANRGFFGSKPFSKTNNYLKKPIKW